MKLVSSRRTDHAIRALIHLSRADEGRKARDLAAAMAVPTTALQHVLQQLTRSGLVTSRPSGNGGYQLAAPPASLSLLDIVEAVEGRFAQVSRCALSGGPCQWEQVCPVHEVWSRAQHALASELSRASLADLAAAEQHWTTALDRPPPT